MGKPRILITGAGGQLANSIRDIQSLYSEFDFIFLDKTQLNLSDPFQIKSVILSLLPDYTINCAAYTQVDKAESQIDLAFAVNATGVGLLAEAMASISGKMIHISTDYIYHSIEDRPLLESDPKKPQGVYARSKLQGEVLLQKSNCQHAIIRTSWVYSPYGKNFVRTMLNMAETRDELNIVDDQKGTPTYASDLAQIIMNLIEKDFTKPMITNQVYNFSNKGITSFYKFAKAIFLLSNINIKLNPIPSSEYPTPAPRPLWSVMNTDKIAGDTGMEMKTWQKSLVECLERLQHEIR